MSIWPRLGFSSNPYDSRPLKANAEGAALLVGRDMESRALMSQLTNTSLHPTLEGANGVGKTSLVLVNIFNAMQAKIAGQTQQALLPIHQVLQIRSDPDRLHREAILAIAQAMIAHKSALQSFGYNTTNLSMLEDWLNNPIMKSGGGGAQILGIGGNAGVSRQVNTGGGFLDSGLEALVRRSLEDSFPTDSAGALVGVIDNVELLSRSKEARRVLEELRDTTFDLPGVRWVLCGALGIVRACVTSPRLDGRVAQPIEVPPVADDDIETLVQARLDYFRVRDDARAPVGPTEFRHLYQVCHNNLRDAMKYAQDFSVWLDVQDELGKPEDYFQLLEIWLAEQAEKITKAITLQPRAWRLFDDLAAAGGACAPSDNEKFGFNTPQQMRTNLAALERVNLIKAEVDEDDLRRRTVNLTDKGWIVRYARSGFMSSSDGAPEARS